MKLWIPLINRASTDPADTGEGGETNALNRWRYFMGGRICNDVAFGEDIYQPMDAALSSYFTHLSDYCSITSGPSWKCLGPFINEYGSYNQQGRIDAGRRMVADL